MQVAWATIFQYGILECAHLRWLVGPPEADFADYYPSNVQPLSEWSVVRPIDLFPDFMDSQDVPAEQQEYLCLRI